MPDQVPKSQPEVDDQELWWLLLSTTRYAMGRMSAIPPLAADLVRKFRPRLSENQIAQIRDEVTRELAIAERQDTFLGMACDHATWKKLVEDLS